MLRYRSVFAFVLISLTLLLVTAFLREWKETSINQWHLWLHSWRYGRRHQSINVTCNCLLESMEGDTNQSMSPVAAFLREWKKASIYQCYLWLKDTNQSMSPVTAFLRVWKETSINQWHLWLHSWRYGRRHQSINVTCNCLLESTEGDTNQSMSPVTAFLKVCMETSKNQSMSLVNAFFRVLKERLIKQCHLWLPSLGCGRRHPSVNVNCDRRQQSINAIRQFLEMSPVTAFLRVWNETPVCLAARNIERKSTM